MSDSHICTLFEGHYHYGLGALINSLHASGFVGTLWVGYRGELPGWIKQLSFSGESGSYLVSKQFKIVFIKLDTNTHFTLYKPDFMLQLIERHCPEAKFLFYFDPDILIKAKWSYFENWANHGVALCEDVNSPLCMTSPLRKDWEAYFRVRGVALMPQDDIYVNGGFIGVSAENFPFLAEWKSIQDLIKPDLPAMDQLHSTDRSHPFNKLDQDALNIAKDLTGLRISVANKESMDFLPGGTVMSHAIGMAKPWNKNFVKQLLLTGNRPGAPDRLFYRFVRFPIDVYAGQKVKSQLRKLNLVVTSILSRLLAN